MKNKTKIKPSERINEIAHKNGCLLITPFFKLEMKKG